MRQSAERMLRTEPRTYRPGTDSFCCRSSRRPSSLRPSRPRPPLRSCQTRRAQESLRLRSLRCRPERLQSAETRPRCQHWVVTTELAKDLSRGLGVPHLVPHALDTSFAPIPKLMMHITKLKYETLSATAALQQCTAPPYPDIITTHARPSMFKYSLL